MRNAQYLVRNHLWWMGLLLALGISIIIRVPYFGSVPVGLNRDEAALGYNAFSLWKAGVDEYGTAWPVSITSFGDQKLPGYVYTLLPFVGFGGLSTVSIRLPSLIAGWFVIVGVGVFLKNVQKPFINWNPLFSILGMVSIALSPWGNHFSRVAYEAHVAMAFFVWGVVVYQKMLTLFKEKTQQRFYVVLTTLLFSLSMLTYHSYHIVVPVFALGMFLIDFKKIKKIDSKSIILAISIGVLVIMTMFFGGVWKANQQKSIGISPFNRVALQKSASVFRQFLPGSLQPASKLFFNAPTEALTVFTSNVVSVISGQFFWVMGMGQDIHNPGNIPNHHLFSAPFFVLGMFVLWEERKHADVQKIAVWLLAAIAAPSLTIQPQHTTRFSPGFPVVEIIVAFGLCWVVRKLESSVQRKIFVSALLLVAVWSVVRLLTGYLLVVPQTQATNERYSALAVTLRKYAEFSDTEVITQSPSSSPYIWYVVATSFDPKKLQDLIERYSPDPEGFIHVKRINSVFFETVNWNDLTLRSKQKNLVLVFRPQETPIEWRENKKIELLETIVTSTGEVVYEVWLMKKR